MGGTRWSRWHYNLTNGELRKCEAQSKVACPYYRDRTGIHLEVKAHQDETVEYMAASEALAKAGQVVSPKTDDEYGYEPEFYDYTPGDFVTEVPSYEDAYRGETILSTEDEANLYEHRQMKKEWEEGRMNPVLHWLYYKLNVFGYRYAYSSREDKYEEFNKIGRRKRSG